jgi:Zn-dependent M28 family amino/carboxypeptidase
MKRTLISLLLALLFLTSSCAQKSEIAEASLYNEDKLLERLELLSSDKFEGRKTGEKGNDSARAYIIKQFQDLKVSAFNDNYEQSFTFQADKKMINGVNVLAKIKGTEKPEDHIVISAHYDHLGVHNGTIYNGADDDASGISALISFAEYLVKNPPKHSVIFAAFDAEEIGLQGAKHFVKTIHTHKVILNINMDMISRSDKNELYVVGSRYHEGLKTLMDEFKNPTSTKLLQGHDGTDGKENWTMSSDHGPFHMAKIPFLYFGNEDHSAYHKPEDDFEAITPEFYKNAVKIILAVFLDIDASGF